MKDKIFNDCVTACYDCANACQQCTAALVAGKTTGAPLVQHTMACATICLAAAQLMNHGSDFAEKICNLCAEICHACAAECEKHPDIGHCQRCAETCKICKELCLDVTGAMKH